MSSRATAHHYSGEHLGRSHEGHRDERRAAHRHGYEVHGQVPGHEVRERASVAETSRRAQDGHGEHSVSHYYRRVPQMDYTVGHGAWQVRVGPVAFWTIVGTLVIMAGWSVVTATYFAFHDDVLTRLISRQAEMQFAYEDRIAEMRAQVDRVTSRQLLDQEQFERKLETLLRRQSTLESRAGAIGAVADPAVTGAIKPGAGARAPASATGDIPIPKPSPISDKVIFTAPPDREARLESRGGTATRLASSQPRSSAGLEGTIARLQDSLDRLEARQSNALNVLEETYESKTRRMRAVFHDLGLDIGKGPAHASGGPFVPYKLPVNATAFDRQLHRISLARAQADRLSRAMVSVPIRQPVLGEIDTTSGFGVRLDPFLGRPAMHTGLDFRGTTGDPIRATAAGTVTSAGWQGGYGKMVEVDHGNGLSTRYGHMSEIDVSVGQRVRIGQTLGRIGSTGRSTGPHLHYETRIDGDAVDPQKFLRAGIRLGS
jgi:murein DD-endopeptidase MepM/ murein hydrolase activator NlpD